MIKKCVSNHNSFCKHNGTKQNVIIFVHLGSFKVNRAKLPYIWYIRHGTTTCHYTKLYCLNVSVYRCHHDKCPYVNKALNDCNAKWIISRNIHIMFRPLREVGIPYPCYGGFVSSGQSRSMQQQGKTKQPPIKVPVKVICLHPSGTVAGIIQQININSMGLLSDMHVPRCMPGLLTSGFLEVGGGKMFPAFPAHAQPAILRIW